MTWTNPTIMGSITDMTLIITGRRVLTITLGFTILTIVGTTTIAFITAIIDLYRFGFHLGFHYGSPYLWTGLSWYRWNFSFGYPYYSGHNLYYSSYRHPYRTLNLHPHRGGRRHRFRNRNLPRSSRGLGNITLPRATPITYRELGTHELQRKYPGAFGKTSTLTGVTSPVPSTDFRTTTKFRGRRLGENRFRETTLGPDVDLVRRALAVPRAGGFRIALGASSPRGSTVAPSSDLPSRTTGFVRMHPARERESQASGSPTRWAGLFIFPKSIQAGCRQPHSTNGGGRRRELSPWQARRRDTYPSGFPGISKECKDRLSQARPVEVPRVISRNGIVSFQKCASIGWKDLQRCGLLRFRDPSWSAPGRHSR